MACAVVSGVAGTVSKTSADVCNNHAGVGAATSTFSFDGNFDYLVQAGGDAR